MLLKINKKLLRNELKAKERFESIGSYQPINFIDWFYRIINGQTQDQDQQNEQTTKIERQQRRVFLKQNFDNLVKKRQLVELLFYVWVKDEKILQIQHQTNLNSKDQRYQISASRINFALQAKSFLIDIIRYNPRLNKELYHVIESNSDLGQTYLKPSHYQCIYQLIVEIDHQISQNKKENLNKPGKCWQFFIDQLTFWWSLNKDYLITTKYCYLRYNLLAVLIQKTDKEQFLSYQDGALIPRISSGIQKRLIEPKYRKSAVLIWTKFAKLLDMDTQIDFKQEAQYFEIQQTAQKSNEKKQIFDSSLIQQHAKVNINQSNLNSNQKGDEQNNKESNQIAEKYSDNKDDFQDEHQFVQFNIKAPKTLQDCILALQNPLRCQIGLKQLKILIKKQEEDLIFLWKSLIKSLIHPLTEQSGQILKDLLIKKPTQWIRDVEDLFFKKNPDMNEKVILIECIELGINQLSQNPSKCLEEPEQKGDFYFKRVASKYYTEKPIIESKTEPQSKRWGHTRIAHQQKMKKNNQAITSLIIVGSNDPYFNRLYPIIAELFFKIIIKMIPQSQKACLSNPLLSQRILNLLGTVAHCIKNYFEKYLILEEILIIVERILTYIQSECQKQKNKTNITISEPNWNAKSVSTTVMSCIQVLNKVVLSIDKYLPEMMILNLKDCVQKLKKIDIYGIRPLVEMLEANIFNRIN